MSPHLGESVSWLPQAHSPLCSSSALYISNTYDNQDCLHVSHASRFQALVLFIVVSPILKPSNIMASIFIVSTPKFNNGLHSPAPGPESCMWVLLQRPHPWKIQVEFYFNVYTLIPILCSSYKLFVIPWMCNEWQDRVWHTVSLLTKNYYPFPYLVPLANNCSARKHQPEIAARVKLITLSTVQIPIAIPIKLYYTTLFP